MEPSLTSPTTADAADGAADGAGDPTFTLGPPHPVTDSRRLPAIDAQDEASVVSGGDLGDDHPDNTPLDAADPELGDPADLAEDEPEDLPGDDELAALVADVDPDAVDDVGFDDSDLTDPVEPLPATTGGS